MEVWKRRKQAGLARRMLNSVPFDRSSPRSIQPSCDSDNVIPNTMQCLQRSAMDQKSMEPQNYATAARSIQPHDIALRLPHL